MVVASLLTLGRRRAILAATGVIAIPAPLTVLTVDGTRLLVATGLAALSALVAKTWRSRSRDSPPSPQVLGPLSLALVLIQAIVVGANSELRLPHDAILDLVDWGFV